MRTAGLPLAIAMIGVLAASTAAAEVTVQVSPATATPGAAVRVTAACTANTGTAESAAFGLIRLQPAPGGGLTGEGTVNSTAAPDTYAVRVTCADGSTGRATFRVVTPPRGPVDTGGGGTAGPDTAMVVTGLAVALAGLAVGVFAFLGPRIRRRRALRT